MIGTKCSRYHEGGSSINYSQIGNEMDWMKEVSSQVRETEDGYNVFELLDKAQKILRYELLRQSDNGNNRHKITCILEAQVNIAKAIEALFDSQQPL